MLVWRRNIIQVDCESVQHFVMWRTTENARDTDRVYGSANVYVAKMLCGSNN